MQLLERGSEADIVALVAERPAALRYLVGRLWDSDSGRARRAAERIGAVAAEDREQGLELMRRFLWGLNDESATNGAPGIAAMGEIGARCPELAETFARPLASFAWDDGLRVEIIDALARMAKTRRSFVREAVDMIAPHVNDDDEEERGAFERLRTLSEEGEKS